MLRERIVQRESDTPFNVGVENVAIEAIKRMVIQGLGIGFVPRMCVQEEAASGKIVPIEVDGLRTEWNLSLVFRKGQLLSPAARAFVGVSLASAESLAESEEALPEDRGTTIIVLSDKRRSFAIHPGKVIHC